VWGRRNGRQTADIGLYGPAVTQDSFVVPSATLVAADPNGHQRTRQSLLEARQRFSRVTRWETAGARRVQAEAAAGMYKKRIEVLAREVHYEPLPPELRAVVIAAWRRGDLLPEAAIERIVPEKSA
jgi:hypothetical protein